MKKIRLIIMIAIMLFLVSCEKSNTITPNITTPNTQPTDYLCFETGEGWRIILGDYPQIDHSDSIYIHYKNVSFESLEDLQQCFLNGMFDSHEKETLEACLPIDSDGYQIIFDLGELAYPDIPEGMSWNDDEEISLTMEIRQPSFRSYIYDTSHQGIVYMFITSSDMEQNISDVRITRENTENYQEIKVLRNSDELQNNESAIPILVQGVQYINSYGDEGIQICYEFTENTLQYFVFEELDADDKTLKHVRIYVNNDNHYFLYYVPAEMFIGEYPTREEIMTFGIKIEAMNE